MASDDDRYTFEELWRRYRTCRRNKRNTRNALAFEIEAEAKLLDLQRELRDHTYRPGRSICFVTDGPKPREVFAADFRDRVVHHLLVHHLEHVFEPRFIYDSYACRRDTGTAHRQYELAISHNARSRTGRRPGPRPTDDAPSAGREAAVVGEGAADPGVPRRSLTTFGWGDRRGSRVTPAAARAG